MKKGDQIMWLIIFGSVLIAALAGVFYLMFCVGRLGFVQSLAGDRAWLKHLISFIIIGAVFGIVSFSMSMVNAVIVLLHEAFFFLVFGGILRIISHISGKGFSPNRQGIISVVFSIAYLAIGYYLLHNVWKTTYTLDTDKPADLRIAMFADSHLGTTFGGEGFEAHMKEIEAQKPDIVFIPGDFVDDGSKKEDLLKACEALGKMDVKYGVWFSYGNHDKGYFNSRDFNANELEKALTDNGVHVLSDAYELVDDSFYVVGRLDSSIGKRKSMEELLEGVDTSKYIIVLDHEPNDYANEALSAADLVVSGHTHGGQLFPATYAGEWFGINDRTYGYENRNGTDFIVTSGISDWEIQFKTGTKSEYVIIDVNGKTEK